VNEPEPKPEARETRDELAQEDEAFFNQSGTVSEALPETDTSGENSAANRQPERGRDDERINPPE